MINEIYLIYLYKIKMIKIGRKMHERYRHRAYRALNKYTEKRLSWQKPCKCINLTCEVNSIFKMDLRTIIILHKLVLEMCAHRHEYI